MKKLLFVVALASAMSTVSGANPAKPAAAAVQKFTETIAISADKNEAKCGEKITFNIKVSGKNVAKRAILAEIEGNAKIRARKTLTTDDAGNAKLEIISERPGMVYCKVGLKNQPRKTARLPVSPSTKKMSTLPCHARQTSTPTGTKSKPISTNARWMRSSPRKM